MTLRIPSPVIAATFRGLATFSPRLVPGPLLATFTIDSFRKGIWLDPSCFTSISNIHFVDGLVKGFAIERVFVPEVFLGLLLRDDQGDLETFLTGQWDANDNLVGEANEARRTFVRDTELQISGPETRARPSIQQLFDILREDWPEGGPIAFDLIDGALKTGAPIIEFETSPGRLTRGLKHGMAMSGRTAVRFVELGSRGHRAKMAQIKKVLERLPDGVVTGVEITESLASLALFLVGVPWPPFQSAVWVITHG